MKIAIYAVCFVFLAINPFGSFAQNWVWAHDSDLTDEGGSPVGVAVDNLGNIYTIADSLLFKHNAYTGAIDWVRHAAGRWLESYVATDAAGYIYYYRDSLALDVSTSSLNHTYYLLSRLDPSGRLLWTQSGQALGALGGVYATGIVATADGHIYVVGNYNSDSVAAGAYTLHDTYPRENAYVAKYDTAGHLAWIKQLTTLYGTGSITGVFGVSADAAGNFFIVGENDYDTVTIADTTVRLPSLSHNMFVVKADSNFHLRWVSATNKSNATSLGNGIYQVGADSAGNAYVSGYYFENDVFGTIPVSYAANKNVFVAKYQSATGNVLWVTTGGGGHWNNTYSLAVNKSGHSYVLFPSSDTVTFGDSSFIFSYPFAAELCLSIMSLDSSGHVSCGTVLGGASGDDVAGVGIDNAGNGYICGDFMATCAFGDTVLSAFMGEEYFAAKFRCTPCYGSLTLPPDSLRISATGGDTVCPGSLVTLTAAVAGGGPVNYQWQVNGVTVAGSDSVYAYIPSGSDSVSCIITNPNPCSEPFSIVSNMLHLYMISSDAAAGIYLTASPGDTVCAGDTITCNALSEWGGSSPRYMWYKNGVVVDSGITSYSFVPSRGDSVRCVLTSSIPCLPSRIASSQDIVFTTKNCAAGINAATTKSVAIFPNPAKNVITVTCAAGLCRGTTLSISDVYGRILSTLPLTATNTTIPVTGLPGGLYFCTFAFPDGSRIVDKLFIANTTE